MFVAIVKIELFIQWIEEVGDIPILITEFITVREALRLTIHLNLIMKNDWQTVINSILEKTVIP